MAARRKRCADCGELFQPDLPDKDGAGKGVCPTPLCWARRTYDAEARDGACRMARARIAAGVELNDVDRFFLGAER